MKYAIHAPIMAVVAGLAAPAAAQQQSGQAGLEEIIVTAQKRSESLQNVPISVTAITGRLLEEAGISDTQQLSNVTPGLLVQRSIVGKVNIRGVGNENYTIAGDPGVAIHSDGVYVARPGASLFDFFDIGRVEVLRGPQGTLYGRNATGGVINVIPAEPTTEFSGHLQGEYGNYNHGRVEGAVSGPIAGDKLLFRISGLGSWRNGYTKNIFPGAAARGFDQLDNQDMYAFRAQLEYGHGENLTVRLAVEDIRDHSIPSPYKYLTRPLPAPIAAGVNPVDLRTVSEGFESNVPGTNRTLGPDNQIFKSTQIGVSAHVDWTIGDVTLKSISGYRETRFNWLNDGDGVDIFYVNYAQQDRNKQYSQELQFASSPEQKLSWLVGGFYFHEQGGEFIALPFPVGFNLPLYILIDGNARTNAVAGFGDATYHFNDRLSFTAGLRYSHEERKSRYDYQLVFGPPLIFHPNLAADFNAVTPKFVLSYVLAQDTNVYASATRGFKSGGFNLLAVQPGYNPEYVWSYEGGVKSAFADGRARLNASVFYYDYKDMQVGQIVNLQSVLTNAARSTLYGAEVEFNARPVEALEIGATAAYLHTKYDEFCTGDPTKPNAAISPGCTPTAPINLAGNRLPRAPEWALTANVAYTWESVLNGSLTLFGNVRYQSKIFFTQFNRPEVSQGGYAVVDARLTWSSPGDRWSISFWAKNLTDHNYFTELLESGAFNPTLVVQSNVAPPRTFAASVGLKF